MKKVTLEDIHECLIGNKLAGQKGIIDTIDELVDSHERVIKCQEKTDGKVCIMQNQLSTLMQDREKRIEAEKNKISWGKVFKKIASVFLTAKTGT